MSRGKQNLKQLPNGCTAMKCETCGEVADFGGGCACTREPTRFLKEEAPVDLPDHLLKDLKAYWKLD